MTPTPKDTSTTLVHDFLLARLAEDEANARALLGDEWHAFEPPEWMRREDRYQDISIHSPRQLIFSAAGLNNTEAIVAHVTTHDPARVLAEVEAKRAIVEVLGVGVPDPHSRGEDCNDCLTLRLLATVYVSHPDYNEAWRA